MRRLHRGCGKGGGRWGVRAALQTGVVAGLLGIGGGLSAQERLLDLSPYVVAPGQGVAFGKGRGLPQADIDVTLESETEGGHYKYAFDSTRKISWDPVDGQFRYYAFYVRNVATGVATLHKITAKPSGTFEDQRVQVKLTITEGELTDSAFVRVPIKMGPGLAAPSPIEITRAKDPEPVEMGGQRQVRMRVRNKVAEQAVELSNLRATADPALWLLPLRIQGPARLEGGSEADLTLQLQPRLLAAARRSFIPVSRETAHTTVRLEGDVSNPNFVTQPLAIDQALGIRFEPGPLALAAALVGGVLLGSLVSLLDPRPSRRRYWFRATLTALVVAVILDLVGVFLVSFGSQFKVFTFDLDPRETLPTLLLGVFNGLLGLNAAERLKFVERED